MALAKCGRIRQCNGGYGETGDEQIIHLVRNMLCPPYRTLIAAKRSTFTPMVDTSVHPITTDDLERDAILQQRINLFGWVREKHLDVPEGEASQGFLAFAEQGAFPCSSARSEKLIKCLLSELLKINHYKAPRDKMICILNCCKVIFGTRFRGYPRETRLNPPLK